MNSENLRGVVYVSSGLGGMSGAQGKASVISGAIGVIAEVDPSALHKRHEQGWVQYACEDIEECIDMIKKYRNEKPEDGVSIGYHGNVVTLWERLAEEKELLVELGSDQTSLHNPYNGGYYPVQLTFEESQQMMSEDPENFKLLVQESLRRQVAAINKCVDKGMHFWDYGNCFLLESSRAEADIFAAKINFPQFKHY